MRIGNAILATSEMDLHSYFLLKYRTIDYRWLFYLLEAEGSEIEQRIHSKKTKILENQELNYN